MSQNHHFFQQEMRYLRKSVEDFSRTYPEIAAELQLSAGRSADPHVEQLLQSFAYMTGRLRADLVQQQSQIPNQLLSSLYPNLMRSLPCMTVLQANVEIDGANFINGYVLEKGRQFVATASRIGANGEKDTLECRFENSYETPLWPLIAEKTDIIPKNSFAELDQLGTKSGQLLKSILSIKVSNLGTDPIKDYPIDRLRFYIADVEQRAKLYQLLNDHLLGVAVRVGDKITRLDGPSKPLSAILQWQGFEEQQNVLPDDAGSLRAYRLLQEYFSFTEKFYFLDIKGLDECDILSEAHDNIEVLLLLEQSSKSIHLHPHCFKLNCFPAINLYEKTFKPIALIQSQHEYRLLADERHYLYGEVHNITDVRSIAYNSKSRLVSPWLGANAQSSAQQFYITRPVDLLAPGEHGLDILISLYQPDFSPSDPVDQTLVVKGLCNNRRIPESLRAGQTMQLVGSGPMINASIQDSPSKFRAAKLQSKNTLKLLSQLSLNLSSLSGKEDSLVALKQTLGLYSHASSMTHQRQLAGIDTMNVQAITKRIGADSWRGHCRGSLITLAINEDYFSDSNPLLFGAVLSYFFGLYTTLNHFVQLQLVSDQREGVWRQWQPRIGEKVIL
ncbi:type VI secretion system baseplate subunit TssF [Vibrio gazogenes]|uniref:Type VI secretion system protein ImpG n=1 Tax=Vibrio gazogenes DSM 21264 = NBRC 103151 TaxID=1123492 RepID=A0A1M4TFA5_VIBGA|nr:type VI secretion system baseplate subunit TssF [Vibrio gazogenes]USP16082.1 type VI secretion system baseplate subunit TssF [Vibrio gazogenes]SHE43078.1 type VI secretion system protein ImpG [Vibrio gazogenes DSM 21264] [Vibrio gazogenes DSM 21264 = NBRC 103151]SJN54242.1 hypothetical protein BQ6471_00901 [Vibrio gazogenes]